MLNHQKKKIKSHEKDSFRKTSPNNLKGNMGFQGKSYRKKMQMHGNCAKQSSQQEIQSKQFSFMRFIPMTSKNLIQRKQQGYHSIKQLKIPSFFKKPNRNKDIQSDQNNIEINEYRSQQNSVNNRSNSGELNSMQESSKSNVETLNSSFSVGQLNQYKKLNDKINYLQSKIGEMKSVLDKKRKEKLLFFESEKTDRASTIFSDEDTSTCSSSQTPLKQFVTQVPQHKGLHAFSQNPYSPRHSTYYVSQILRAYKQDKSLARQHILSSVQYLRMFEYAKIPDEKKIQHLKVNLLRPPGYEDKKTIIFDLDQTLIHCNQNVHLPSDIKIKINFPTGELIQVGINIRPYAKEILAALSKKFQIIVFTASHSCYANVVLDYLDPQKKHIHHRLFRESCYCTPEGVYVKDLRILNRNLSKVVLVDNAAYSYAFQPLNGVPIIPYYQGKNDYELTALQKYIESLIFSYDVREKNKNTFKLDQYSQFDNLNSLVETLYSMVH